MKHVGIVIADRGSAIVHVEHDGDNLLVTAIERMPFNLSAVADRVDELDGEIAEVRFVIDHEGLGAALWAVLGPPDGSDRWRLYTGRGVARQALVDALLVAVHEGRFHFAPNLPEQEAMTKALQSYRRQVREDGIVGSELVVALLLGIMAPEPQPEPDQFAWGPSPFDPPDEADGVLVGGLIIRRAPDGSLVAVQQQTEKP